MRILQRISGKTLFTAFLAPLLLWTVSTAEGEWQSGPQGQLFLNFPAGWKIHEVREDKVTASNKAEEAYFILRYYERGRFSDITELDNYVRGELGRTRGEGEQFRFAERNASFGSITFEQEGSGYEGYVLSIKRGGVDVSAVAFTSSEGIDAYRDMLRSVLDTVSIGHSGVVHPGPVSVFDSPYPSRKEDLKTLSFEDKKLPIAVNPGEVEFSQELIEREARLLSIYGGSEYATEAWKRYYRILYRDLYARTAPVYSSLRQHVFNGEESDREVAERLLSWVQSFEYKRYDSVSDLLSPLRGALESAGDCDTRTLLYVILLHYFDIDAVLMVSSIYAHSVAAVDLDGEGARFSLGEKEYLIAETTEEVDLGLIDQEMSNTNAWIGIDFIQFRGSEF
ncbi:MAG: hypothetical protein R6V67_08845 [Spirochaetia bacterium]